MHSSLYLQKFNFKRLRQNELRYYNMKFTLNIIGAIGRQEDKGEKMAVLILVR